MNSTILSTNDRDSASRIMASAMTPHGTCLGVLAILILMYPQFFELRLLGMSAVDADSDGYVLLMLRCCAVVGICVSAVLLAYRGLRDSYSVEFIRRWIIACSVGLLAALSISYWWYVNDDAAISFTYARNLVEGHGLVLNPGDEPVEGFSNPLWVSILALCRLAGADIVVTAKLLGLVLSITSILIVARILRCAHPVALVALPLAACSSPFVIWSTSGLETALHAALLTSLCALLMDRPVRGRLCKAGIAIVLSALILVRPEGVLFTFSVGGALVYDAVRKRRGLAEVLQVLAWPIAVLIVQLGARLWYFGDWLPNTYYAKGTDANLLRLLNPLSGGWSYVGSALVSGGWMLLALPALLAVGGRQGRGAIGGAVLIVATQIVFVVSVGGDWMSEYRFVAPIVPLLTVLAGFGWVALWRMAAGTDLQRLTLGIAVITVWIVIGIQARRLVRFERRPTTSMEMAANVGSYFKGLAVRAGVDDPLLLHHDAGGTTFVARIRLLDLGGLCDRVIAREWRNRSELKRYIFDQKKPTFIFSGPGFAQKTRIHEFEEFDRDYVALPKVEAPDLAGYLCHVRRDVAKRLFSDRVGPQEGTQE